MKSDVKQKHEQTYLCSGQKQSHGNNLIFSLSNQKRLELNISYVKIEHIMNDLRKAFFYYREARVLTFSLFLYFLNLTIIIYCSYERKQWT
jgi:hypothetical protein